MILDTNAISALSEEEGDLLKALGGSVRHHLPVVVIGEYGFGLAGSRKAKLHSWFSQLISESIVLPIDLETAARYSSVYAELRRTGRPIPTNDIGLQLWPCSTTFPWSAATSTSTRLAD